MIIFSDAQGEFIAIRGGPRSDSRLTMNYCKRHREDSFLGKSTVLRYPKPFNDSPSWFLRRHFKQSALLSPPHGL